MKELKCAFCDEMLNDENQYEFDGTIMCKHCLDANTVVCQHCGTRIWREDNEGNIDKPLCTSCYDAHYTHCEDCGRILAFDDAYYFDDNDYPYCRECYERINSRAIHDYGYKPEPKFYGSGPLFMGVELEVDIGGEINENAEKVLDIANNDADRLYIKHDGSIEDGFEMVSHPMTLDYHTNIMCWQAVFDKVIDMGYRSHQTSTCGLHIHVSRSALGTCYEEIEDTVARIVFFVEKHWDKLLKFSRRTEANINRWASRYGISENTKETYKNAKDKHMGRYVAVNLENYNTVEFRLFRGTLKYETFIATLQIIQQICDTCKKLTDDKLEKLSWDKFVKTIKHPELIDYLKSKNIYMEVE